MERRVQELEKAISDIRERLARVDAKLDGVAEHGATKADIMGTKAHIEAMGARIEATARSIIQWSIGSSLVLAGLAFAAARFISTGSPV